MWTGASVLVQTCPHIQKYEMWSEAPTLKIRFAHCIEVFPILNEKQNRIAWILASLFLDIVKCMWAGYYGRRSTNEGARGNRQYIFLFSKYDRLLITQTNKFLYFENTELHLALWKTV